MTALTRDQQSELITAAEDGLDVFDFEAVARKNLSPAHFGYLETGTTIECVPEVAAGAAGRVPVLADSGFRRGTDIFKALALGASAVGVGRPYIWGLAAFGQEGAEAVLAILRRELQLVMRQAGTVDLGQITPAHVVDRRKT